MKMAGDYEPYRVIRPGANHLQQVPGFDDAARVENDDVAVEQDEGLVRRGIWRTFANGPGGVPMAAAPRSKKI
jgi:hypothetical protein